MITDLFTQIRDDDSHILLPLLSLMIPIMKTMVMMLVINYFDGVDGNVAGSDCWLWSSFSILWPARVMNPVTHLFIQKPNLKAPGSVQGMQLMMAPVLSIFWLRISPALDRLWRMKLKLK